MHIYISEMYSKVLLIQTLFMNDVAFICLPVQVGHCLLLSFIIHKCLYFICYYVKDFEIGFLLLQILQMQISDYMVSIVKNCMDRRICCCAVEQSFIIQYHVVFFDSSPVLLNSANLWGGTHTNIKSVGIKTNAGK